MQGPRPQRRKEVMNQPAHGLIWEATDHTHDVAIELYETAENDLVAVVLTAENPPICLKIFRAAAETLAGVLQRHLGEIQTSSQATRLQQIIPDLPAFLPLTSRYDHVSAANPTGTP